MINYLLEVSCCWLGFYLVYVVWLSKETFFNANRWYLLVTLLLGLYLPFAKMPAPSVAQQDLFYYFGTVTVGVQQVEQQIATVVAQPISTNLSVQTFLIWIYSVGALFMLFRFGFGLTQILQKYRLGEKHKKTGYVLVLSEEAHLPFSFFGFLFLSTSAKYTEEEIDNIIRHEQTHMKGWHSVDVLLTELLIILFWCCPFIYLYKRSLRHVHEYLADASVLQTTSRKQYGQLLLQQFQKGPGIAIANNFIHSQLKKRILMMTKNQSTNTARWKYLFAIPVFLCLFFALAKTDVLAQMNQPDNTEQNRLDDAKRTHPFVKGTTNTQGDPIFTVVEEMPRFKGCEDVVSNNDRRKCSDEKMLQFIFKNIKYPEAARKRGVEGTVVIKFVIDKTGKVMSPEVVKSIGGGCDKEALRIVETMPNWIPGKQRGKNVNVYFNLPIRYLLEGESKPKQTEKNSRASVSEDEVFMVVEEMPRFPGCEDLGSNSDKQKCSSEKLLEFVYSNIKFPNEAKEAGVDGKVVVSFVINKDGEVVQPEIKKSLGYGTDEAVLSMVQKMMEMEEKWIPGKQRGKVVNVRFALPVRFKMDSEDNAETKTDQATPKFANNTLDVLSFTMNPNPVKDKMRISFEVADYKGLSLQVLDSNGRLIGKAEGSFAQPNNEVAIDVSKSAPGILFVTLRKGDKVFTKQVVKQ